MIQIAISVQHIFFIVSLLSNVTPRFLHVSVESCRRWDPESRILAIAYFRVEGKSMVDACRQHKEASLAEFDAHPLLLEVAEVEVAAPVQTETDLLIQVKVLFKK